MIKYSKIIGKHINNVFSDKELDKASTVANFATTATEFDILGYNAVKRKGAKVHKILELEKQEFLYSLTPKDKKIVQKAIELYYDFMDYQEATKIKKP